ncbi:MAG: hypothetical protein K2M11_00220 [Paramuribaculum sp.]|nr:hypothetical protein [Paramuribaculum sp.]
MKFRKIIPYICCIASFFVTCNHVAAENIIERKAEYIENLHDTLHISSRFVSNSGNKMDIWVQIQAKGVALEIDSIELCVDNYIFKPKAPFSLTVDEEETADSLITWNCIIQFPYYSTFHHYDTWTINTSRGKFTGLLNPWLQPDNISRWRTSWIKYQKYIPLALIILCGIISAGIIAFYRKRNKKDIEEILRIMKQYEAQYEIDRRLNTELREKVETLYAERWNVFNRLCNEYFDKKDSESDSVRLSIYKEVERQINDMRSTKSLAELENLVDSYNNNLIQRLRVQIPTLTKNDITFLIYLYSGFSPRAICLFTDIKIKNFYNRKSRLKDKILESGAPDCEEFASKM